MAPIVSVLMAVYNGEAFLSTAIESVLLQQMSDLELIISDNISTDSTSDIARRYAEQDHRVKYFRNTEHVSATENFNLCYRRAEQSSTYTALLASDDWWQPTFLSRLVEIGEKHPSATFIHADMYRTDADGRIINRYSELFQHHAPAGMHQAARELYFGCYVNIMSTLVNRRLRGQFYPTAEFFDPTLKLTPDYHLWLQLLTRGAHGYYLPEPLAYYRKHAEAMTMPVNSVPRLREEVTIFQSKLRDVQAPELEDARREAVQVRMARLGFELLRTGGANEAKSVLHEARRSGPRRRLDLTVAGTISSLPCPADLRARLWRLADTAARTIRAAG